MRFIYIENLTVSYANSTSLYKHFTDLHNTENVQNRISVKIITRETDPVNLRLKEAFYIRIQKQELNSRKERSELADLLFELCCCLFSYFDVFYSSFYSNLHNLHFRFLRI